MAGKNLFNSVQLQDTKSNVFDLSYEHKLSGNMGDLIPVCVMETIPGDKFHISTETLVRLAPMISPVMHRIGCTIDYFFVPNRILWDGWEDFITPTDLSGAPMAPYFDIYHSTTTNINTWTPLCDYMGIPEPPAAADPAPYERVNALPFAAYQKIWWEYYRDQNLQFWPGTAADDMPPLVDGDNNASNLGYLILKNRAWQHDYFTSALPFAQAGADVQIPLADIELKDDWAQGNPFPTFQTGAGVDGGSGQLNQVAGAGGNINSSGSPSGPLAYNPQGTLGIGQTSINDLRRANKLQEWLERLALGGKRYKETIKAFFNVDTGDARLQRPELIFRQKSPIVIGEVLNTTGTTDAPQGEMAGHGMAYANGQRGSYFCKEHGYIIGLLNVQPDTAYQQGIPKHFSKYQDALQYAFPQFAHIGEQEIQNRELYAYQSQAIGDATFGYIPRYAEYKFNNNMVSGDFRDNLDYWHMGRKFTSLPTLNETFISAEPTHRIFAVDDPDVHKLYIQHYNNVKAVRKLPVYGTGRL